MSNGPDPDWGLLADCIMDDNNEDPKQTRKVMVAATIPVPDDFELVEAADVAVCK